jgi:hypothetical protein
MARITTSGDGEVIMCMLTACNTWNFVSAVTFVELISLSERTPSASVNNITNCSS